MAASGVSAQFHGREVFLRMFAFCQASRREPLPEWQEAAGMRGGQELRVRPGLPLHAVEAAGLRAPRRPLNVPGVVYVPATPLIDEQGVVAAADPARFTYDRSCGREATPCGNVGGFLPTRWERQLPGGA